MQQHFKNFLVLFVLGTTFSLTSNAQDIVDLFKKLPEEFRYEIPADQADSLFNLGVFPVGEQDPEESMSCEVNTLDSYLALTFHFTTGQSGFQTVQYRKFSTIKGKVILLVTEHGGSRYVFEQRLLKSFIWINGKLNVYRKTKLPTNLLNKEFLKSNAESNAELCTSYELSPNESSGFVYAAWDPMARDVLEREFIKYNWNGKKFKRVK